MKRLADYVALRQAPAPLLHYGNRTLTAADVVASVEAARSEGELQSAQPCRIVGGDDLAAIVKMIAADGFAPAIVLPNAADNQPEFETELPNNATPAVCDTPWLVATSGTSGDTKWVRHTLASLTRTLKTDAARGETLRWGLTFDPRRFAGLQVVLQAILGGSSLVIPTDRTNYQPTVAEFRQQSVNAISATPSYWRQLLMAGIGDAVELQLVTLGGEIADAAILSALRTAFPHARITHIYASTEVGVGFAVTDGREGFPESFLNEPPTGVELRVDEQGQLVLRPQATAATFGDGTPVCDDAGWIATGDLVEKRADRFRFLGRASGVINVGGDKVHPREIEDVARGVPGVALVCARAKQSSIVGQLPELFVEADSDADGALLAAAVLARCRSELPRNKWPAAVHVVANLQLSAAGKLK